MNKIIEIYYSLSKTKLNNYYYYCSTKKAKEKIQVDKIFLLIKNYKKNLRIIYFIIDLTHCNFQ